MKTVLVIILAALSLIAIIVFGFYAFFTYSVKEMHGKQTVAENVQVTDEWSEITSEQLLEPTKQVQNVQLLIKNYKYDIQNSDFGNIKLSDGTKIKPEIEVTDENGKVYKLKESSRLGDLIGFSVDEKFHGSHTFPKDVKYKTIRIRGDEPFQCEKIIWYDYDLK